MTSAPVWGTGRHVRGLEVEHRPTEHGDGCQGTVDVDHSQARNSRDRTDLPSSPFVPLRSGDESPRTVSPTDGPGRSVTPRSSDNRGPHCPPTRLPPRSGKRKTRQTGDMDPRPLPHRRCLCWGCLLVCDGHVVLVVPGPVTQGTPPRAGPSQGLGTVRLGHRPRHRSKGVSDDTRGSGRPGDAPQPPSAPRYGGEDRS